jgi:PST family polysaccharide transporter
MGVTLALGSTLLGVLLGRITQQPRLPGIIAVLSLSLVFLTMSVVPSARLTRRKNLQFGAGADLTANIIGAIIAVAMAWYGAGAWSLTAQYVSVYAVRGCLLNWAAFYVPATTFSFRALGSHLASGGILIASRLVEYGGRSAESVLADRIFGTALLGSYNFSNQISKFATDAASNVVWSALYVQALTEPRERVVVLHRQLCRLLGVLLFPATFLAAAAAPELIEVTLGPKWPDLAFMIRVLLPIYTVSAIGAQTGPILLAYGRFDIQFWCMLAFSTGRLLAVGLGYWLGLHGVIYGVGAITVLFGAAMLVLPANATGCRPVPVLLGLVRPVVSSLIATGAFLLLNNVTSPSLALTLASLTGGLFVYVLCMLLIDREELHQDWQSAHRVLRSRASGGPA